MGPVASAPVKLVHVQRRDGRYWRGAAAEMQGWRNSHEDAHFMLDAADCRHAGRAAGGAADEGASFFGVLDGHGGHWAARLAASHDARLDGCLPATLPRRVSSDACLAAAPPASPGGGAPDDEAAAAEAELAFRAAFVETDAWLRAQPRVREDGSGSTCVSALSLSRLSERTFPLSERADATRARARRAGASSPRSSRARGPSPAPRRAAPRARTATTRRRASSSRSSRTRATRAASSCGAGRTTRSRSSRRSTTSRTGRTSTAASSRPAGT